MYKLKTSKSASKRFKVSATGKLLHRKARQNHFNAKQDKRSKQHKRKQGATAETDVRQIRSLLPYK